MGREIQTASPKLAPVGRRGAPDEDFPAAGPAQPAADGYADRLMKLIPGEVIGVYLSMITLLKHSSDPVAPQVPWAVFAFGVAATFFYLRVTLKVRNRRQLALSVVSFCIWAFTLGEPFTQLAWYNGTYAGLLLIAFTFVAPQVPMDDGPPKSAEA
ncbi:hypothetical protein [Pseudomarimonas salicorniae]|uniref:SPW repeat-containing protein n=1 Tax=Pseudomarimonas salicorniae TaxID=2933270 RepID=A0ABT0GJQ3_9GAMM|nr:hypothetical protein [Lysobacter sp. CAU 1642]MCK7594643.1 hypothetical protein [Lysobacter sp. CAU 1642]